MKNNNQSGFSLIQVLIATAMAGGLSLVIAKVMENAQRTQKTLETKQNLNEVFSRVSTYIRNPAICSRVFQIAPGDEIEHFKIDTDPFSKTGIILEKKKEVLGSNIIVEKMEILDSPLAIDPEKGVYDLTFRITLKRKKGKYFMAGTTITKDFIFSAKLCEKSPPHPFLVGLGLDFKISACKKACEKDKNCSFYYSSPESDSDISPAVYGLHYCYLCGKTYPVQSCI